MNKRDLKRYLLPTLVERGTCPSCAAAILWSPELLLWLDERQYGGAAPRGQTPQVPEHRDVCGKVGSPKEWVPPPKAEPVDIADACYDALSEAVAQDALVRLDIAGGTVDAEEWL